MKFVIRPRAGGKTTEALAWLKEDTHRVLLVHDETYAQHLRREHGLTDRQVMSHKSVARLRGRKVEVGVENLDVILGGLLGTGPLPVTLVTATGEPA